MTEHQSVIDIIHGSAVMVDNHHALALFIKRGAFKRVFEVGVNDYQKRFRAEPAQRFLGSDEDISLNALVGIINKLLRH